MSLEVENKARERLKLLSLIVNAIFWFASLGLLAFVVYSLTTKPSTTYFVLSGKNKILLLIVNATAVYVAGFIGACTGVKFNGACLKTYISLTVIFLVMDLFVTAAYAEYYLTTTQYDYGNIWLRTDPSIVNGIHTELQCCGYFGPEDYANMTGDLNLDYSCYYENITSDSIIYTPYVDGCDIVLTDLTSTASRVILSFCVVIMMAEIAGIAIASYILSKLRKRTMETGIEQSEPETNTAYTMIR